MKKAKICIVVAIDQNRGIGLDGRLPWDKIPEDLKHFKDLTIRHPVIMGRKTFESIGYPLKDRTNIVITNNSEFDEPGVTVVNSLEKAIEAGHKVDGKRIFIIGGAQVYEEAIDLADRLFITKIDKEFVVDRFFPEYENIFTKIISQNKIETIDFSLTMIELAKD